MQIKLSDHFNYKKLIVFTVPSVIMMIVTSVYGVIDGIFVSNFVGKNAFSSLNLTIPFIMIISAFGFMLGTGGAALVGKSLGEENKDEANNIFSLIISSIAVLGTLLGIISIIYIEPIALMLGATPELLQDCITYGVIMLAVMPFFMLQVAFQVFAVVANKPSMGLHLSIASGIINVGLDYLFIYEFQMGIAGAGYATAISQVVGGVIPLFYFKSKKNNSNLKLVKPKWSNAVMLNSCSNGSSEMMNNIALSFVSILYNLELMKMFGANGVSAYGVIMYVSFIFASIFIGYTIGFSPIVAYNYGSGNNFELKSVLKKSAILVTTVSIIMTALSVVYATPMSGVFVGYDKELLELTVKAFSLYSISFLFNGLNIFASAFFTSLSNGKVSAFISFMRTFALQSVMLYLLPVILGGDGIWLAVVVSEFVTLIISILLFIANNKYYNYY